MSCQTAQHPPPSITYAKAGHTVLQGREGLFENTPIYAVDPRSLASRIMEVRPSDMWAVRRAGNSTHRNSSGPHHC